MPQLDTASFFTQYVWLMLCYIGFYLTLVKYFLPKLARSVKLRSYKVDTPSFSSVEKTTLLSSGEGCVVGSVKHARTALQDHFVATNAWVDSVVSRDTQTCVDASKTSVSSLCALHHATLKDSATVLPPRAHGRADISRADYGLYLVKVALALKSKKPKMAKSKKKK